VRLQYTLRRSDQQRNRKTGNSSHTNLHDDTGGEGSRLDARYSFRRHCQSDGQSRVACGKGKSIQTSIDPARVANFARESVRAKQSDKSKMLSRQDAKHAKKDCCHFDQREKSFLDPSHSLGMTGLGPSPLRLCASHSFFRFPLSEIRLKISNILARFRF
jgi:hypothetical protein